MKLNKNKTKLMLFNPTKRYDFVPKISVEKEALDTVEELKLLGVVLRSDLKWSSNTESITTKGYKKLWLLKRLKSLGANVHDVLEVYTKIVRPTLEFAAPVWHAAITQAERDDIERVQKSMTKIVLQENYRGYKDALKALNLESLQQRRAKLCTNFALKTEKSSKFSAWFQPNLKTSITRSKPNKYLPVVARTAKMQTSSVSYLTNILNKHHQTK